MSSFLLLVALTIVISLTAGFAEGSTKGKLMAKKGAKIKKMFTEKYLQYYLTLVFSNESKPAKVNLNFSLIYWTFAVSLCFTNTLFNFWSVWRIHGKTQGSILFCTAVDIKQMYEA